jgi:hypothetical protein
MKKIVQSLTSAMYVISFCVLLARVGAEETIVEKIKVPIKETKTVEKAINFVNEDADFQAKRIRL